jgi:hypothetical protein
VTAKTTKFLSNRINNLRAPARLSPEHLIFVAHRNIQPNENAACSECSKNSRSRVFRVFRPLVHKILGTPYRAGGYGSTAYPTKAHGCQGGSEHQKTLHRLDALAVCESRANPRRAESRLPRRSAYKTHYSDAEKFSKCNAINGERLVTDHSRTCFLPETNAVASLLIHF